MPRSTKEYIILAKEAGYPAVAPCIVNPGGEGGGVLPYYLLYGDVLLDRVWISEIPVSNRVYKLRISVLNKIIIPWTSGRVLLHGLHEPVRVIETI